MLVLAVRVEAANAGIRCRKITMPLFDESGLPVNVPRTRIRVESGVHGEGAAKHKAGGEFRDRLHFSAWGGTDVPPVIGYNIGSVRQVLKPE